MKSYFPNHPGLINPTPPTQLERLFKLTAAAQPFASDRGQAWVSLPLGDDGEQIWPARSARFRDWLVTRFRHEHDDLPREHNLRAALRTVESLAHSNPLGHPINLRFAASGRTAGPVVHAPAAVVIDLANEKGESIEITPTGWEITPTTPHSFRHNRPTPLPPTANLTGQTGRGCGQATARNPRGGAAARPVQPA